MKKTLTIALCIAMLASSLAGCAPAKETPKNSSSNSSTNTAASKEEEKKPEFTLPYTGEEIVYKAYGYEGLTIDPNSTVQKAWKEAIGNIKVEWEFVPFNDYTTKAKIYLNSGDIPDILPIENLPGIVNEFGAAGTLLDFSKYEQYMPNLKEYLKTYPNMNYLNTKEGNRYGIMGVQPIDFAGESWFANMTVLNKYNVAVPNTFDEFMTALRTIKKADPKSVPYQSYWNINYIRQWIAMCMEAKEGPTYYDTTDSKTKFSLRESASKHKELIALLADMYKEGLINPEVQTMSFEQELALIGQGNWAFTHLYNRSPETEVFKLEPGVAMPFDIQPMTPPAAASGKRYLPIAYQYDSIPWWGIVCSADAKNPEYLAAYMDMVVSPFSRDLMNFGVEGVTYDNKDGMPVLKDGIDKASHGVGSLYEVWMVGMGPLERSEPWTITQQAMDNNFKNFESKTVTPFFGPTFNQFTADAAEEKAKLETAIKTAMEEEEAKFIYGQRSIDEWDKYVAEIEQIASVDRLLELYNTSEVIVRSQDRIFSAK